MGWEVADEICARAVEVDDRVFLAEIFQSKGIEAGDIEGWVRRKQRLTVSLLADAPRVYPGFEALVARLRPLYRLGVVTGTWRENVDVVLGARRLADAFELRIGKEDVRAVKPDPEAYRLALERLGIEPAAVVALEDSANGLAAARGAGIPTLAIGHRHAQGAWVGPSAFVANFLDTDDIVERLRSLCP
jgi:HAD superfamily hydrolase (TIGR01509 family)